MLYIFSSLFYSYRILLKSGIQVALWDPVSMRRNSKSHAMANAIHVITYAIQTPHFRLWLHWLFTRLTSQVEITTSFQLREK